MTISSLTSPTQHMKVMDFQSVVCMNWQLISGTKRLFAKLNLNFTNLFQKCQKMTSIQGLKRSYTGTPGEILRCNIQEFWEVIIKQFSSYNFWKNGQKLLQSEHIIKNLLKFMIFNEKNDIFLSNNIKKKSYWDCFLVLFIIWWCLNN